MAGCRFRTLSLVLAVCIAMTWSIVQQAGAETFLRSSTGGLVSVQCFGFAGQETQNNYGLWWMQVDGLSLLVFKAMNINTSQIDCHFVSLTNGSHQWFSVYNTSGLAFPCGLNCHWTITDAGFSLHDPVANKDMQVYSWLPPPDVWVAPLF